MRFQRSAEPRFTAFAGHRCISSGPLLKVAKSAKEAMDRGDEAIQVFEDRTGEIVEIDFRGTAQEVARRLTRAESAEVSAAGNMQARGPGRPKLGVIAREVTLLPGHWDWLDDQPGGASAALRRLVYEARRVNEGTRVSRQAQDAVYRFMTTMAGNFPGFEEALRAFYRREQERFDELVRDWPVDVRKHINRLVKEANRRRPSADVKRDKLQKSYAR